MASSIELAQFLLIRAVELDERGRWTESLTFYQDGVTELLKHVRGLSNKGDQQKIRDKIETYINRAEVLKGKLDEKKKMGNYHEQIEIANNEKGVTYEKLFGRFLDENVEQIDVTDPYIHNKHQCYNFLQFCELAIKNCKNVKRINLLTTYADRPQHSNKTARVKQEENLKQLQESLRKMKITLNINYSNTLHDREIVLSNDWVIKIGRGLDIFCHVPEFSIGFTDLSLRPCKETVVNIFHRASLIK
ncbi:MIT domain-containing protein 1 [Diaphorina citri]|uniref:MIT domain-containing protein 1 n=1 Tax=Diaphorina citri TaxID=121845 RepID=A0A1S3CYM4_DIACI|nr:MIT domain-containing protein 1-like [Diaphorina citri]XP_008473974.1 MIT domain-containing protein 1 [Diaphorina citri]XP_026680719.1 MIT domain-containing protein 1 [Diaphorina citri]KAI5702470.1 hypothetical protein M8J75_000472 [Diaphorina citri]